MILVSLLAFTKKARPWKDGLWKIIGFIYVFLLIFQLFGDIGGYKSYSLFFQLIVYGNVIYRP